MTSQEQTNDPQSNSSFTLESTISTDVCTQVVTKEGHVPKIRKPYTISKQREKWSKEEHEKFLEALKLHGRAWKKIEEHVGTKTAVQIRSHAQKFFFKVVRETSSTSVSSTMVEIPPPRPKKKPLRPYPRKFVLPTEKEISKDLPTRSTSPSSSIYENRSPTSVMSPLASENLASENSAARNGSLSPTSFAEAVNSAELFPSNDTEPRDISMKLERFSSLDSVNKPESAPRKIIKLFGQDVVVPCELVFSPSSKTGQELKADNIDMPTSGPINELANGVGKADNNSDSDIPSDQLTLQLCKEKEHLVEAGMVRKSTFLETSNFSKADKGFAPYKRCLSERDTQSPNESIDNERERKAVRLGL